MTTPSLDELLTLEPPPDAHPEASIKLSVLDLRALLALIPEVQAARSHACAKGDGTYMTDEQIEALHDQVADDAVDAAYVYWEELGEAGKQQCLAFARALLKLNPYGDWEALAAGVKALPDRKSANPDVSSPLECFWAELGDVAFNEYSALKAMAEMPQPITAVELLAGLACHIDHDEPPGLMGHQLASLVLELLDGACNNLGAGTLALLEANLRELKTSYRPTEESMPW